ncbi:hypothetical protein BG000_003702 [Podila horticola]|nr:hypothetical protein BG000_003702 [Podila horticola]
MKANNSNKDKSASGTMDPSSTNLSVTATATQVPPLDKTPLKAGEEEAEEGEVMEDIEEGELEDDDKRVPPQDQSQSQSQPQPQIQNNQQKEEGDQDMKEASPEPAVEDEEASSAMSADKPEQQSHIGEEINEDDLNGGLLDGALDDYDDLDQDTEDTEVGNGDHDFSDDDDDVDDDLLDQQLMSDKLDADDVEMHTPNGTALADAKSEERDRDAQGEDEEDEDEAGSTNEKDAPVHSEDSDSDLPDPDPSDLEDGEVNEDAQDDDDEEEDEEDDEEGNADEEDEDAEDEEEAQKKAPTPKKEVVFPQKPTLNRSQATEEELKDSGDELSDLSEFDDTDDSDEDEDDRVPGPKSGSKDATPSAPSGASSSTPSKSGGSGSSTGTGKTGAGRKKSVHEVADDTQEAPKGKSTAPLTADQKFEHPVEVPNGRARLIEPAGRNRSVSNAETNQSDKDSGSEAAEENEEEEEEAPEETPVTGEQEREEEEGDGGDEDDDLETKQIHKEALEALTSIEVEFASLRDKMYEERMLELDKEVEMINNGTHPELSSLMQEIAQKREQRLQVADAGKRYKSDIAQSQFEVAEYLAHCTFQSARRNARGDMARELGSKQRKMILELTSSADTQKRKFLAEKSALIRARKQRRMEVAELKSISERRAFPTSSKLAMVSSIELEDDFSAMGLARLLPQPPQPPQPVQPQYAPAEQEMYGHRPMQVPSTSGPAGYGPSMPHPSRAPPVHSSHNNRWPEPDYPPPHQNMAPPSGRYYGNQ